ncbi:MAG: DUF3999 domain-containing protein, partial [Betaproteobacteria bacterium]
VYALAVEASPDLQQWRVVQPAAQVLSLEHQGQRLLNTEIDLGSVRASYLRITALAGSAVPELQSATVTSVTQQIAAQAMQWSEPISPASCESQHCDYALPHNLPLEQAQITLSEPNTVATIALLGQVDTLPTPHRHRHLLHGPVKALRHKTEPASAASAAPTWWPLANANVYRLIRVQTTGPISQLGPTPPTLRVGAHTRSLVFLARGPGPYRLVWGGTGAAPSAMPLAQLMPARQVGDSLPSDMATVAMPAASAAAPSPASQPNPAVVTRPSTHRSLWLWAVLLAGVGLMGFMAWVLLRGAKANASPPAPR